MSNRIAAQSLSNAWWDAMRFSHARETPNGDEAWTDVLIVGAVWRAW